MPQKGAGHLPKERLHDIEPRSVFRCQHVLETVGAGSEKSSGLFGNVRRMIIQDDPDGAIRRVVWVEILEQGDEFAAAVPALNAGCDMALMQIQRRENRARSKALVLMIPAHAGMFSWYRGQVGRGVGDGLKARLFIDGNRNDGRPLVTGPLRLVLQRNLLINQQYVPHPDRKGGIALFQIVPDSLGMQRLVGQDPLPRGFGGAAYGRVPRLHGLSPNMLRQQTARP